MDVLLNALRRDRDRAAKLGLPVVAYMIDLAILALVERMPSAEPDVKESA